MIPNEFREILDLVYKKTENDEVNWRDDTNESIFSVSVPKYSILIQKDFKNRVRIRLMNKYGNDIEDFEIPKGEDDYQLVKELYDMARRRAGSIDDAVSDLKNIFTQKGSTGA